MQIQAFYQLSYCGSLFQLNYTYFSDGSDNPLFWGTVAIKKEIKQTEKKTIQSFWITVYVRGVDSKLTEYRFTGRFGLLVYKRM